MMATRSSSRADGYTWSEWEWDEKRGKYYRYRYNSKKKQVWESREAEPVATPRTPVPTSSTIQRFSSSAADNNPQYFESGSNEYAFNTQTPNSDPGGITQAMATTTLTEEGPTAEDYNDSARSGPSDFAYQIPVAQSYQATYPNPRPVYRQQPPVTTHERSMFSPIDRVRTYTQTTGSSFASSAPIGIEGPPSSGADYNSYIPRTQEDDDEEEDYSDGEPYEQQVAASSSSSSRQRESERPSASHSRRRHRTRRTSGHDRAHAPSRSYDTDATITQANLHRSRHEPPQPPELPMSINLSTRRENTNNEILGTSGNHEQLDRNFKIHKSKYFKPGQIFKVVWAEPQGETRLETASLSGRTDVTSESWTADGAHGTKVYSSVRRFVVVATGNGFSNCVPILTYGRQGLAKPGITPEYHAIIYSTTEAPALAFEPHLEPIQFEGSSPRHKLEPMSLINYAKIYPVEHNVKVQFIGWIAQASQRPFVRDFNVVWESHNHMRFS